MQSARRRLVAAATLLPLTSLAAELPRVRMFELYKDDKSYTDTAKRLAGKTISMQGFMAPHLKVESDFFVLSNAPVETCPFCASEDEWIDTIVFVRMKKRQEATRPGNLIQVEGKLEIGPQTDVATGFVSRVRLVEATFRVL